MTLRLPVLSLLAAALVAGEAPATTPASEAFESGTKRIPVRSSKDITLRARTDEAVKSRILWYRAFDGKQWGQWQKHGIQFDRQTAITWAAGEGHWQTHVQIEQTSGAKSPDPSGDIAAVTELIVDRTAPAVRVVFPAANDKLRGGDRYTVRWEATDAYLRNAPITIRFSRDGSTWDTLADGIANSGSFEWTTPRDMTPTGQLRIEALDKAGNPGQAVIGGLVVDSVRPSGEVTAPAISSARAITFATTVRDTGPAGLAGARLWFSQDDGTSWTEGPFIQAPYTSVPWTAPADGRFRLAVVATDGAGNQTAAPRGKDGAQFVTVVDTVAPTIALASTIGINDANNPDQVARRAFAPGNRLQVAFTARDANLKPNSVAVWLQLDPAKPWVELGRDLATDTAFRFELGKDVKLADTKSARIKVTASDLAGNVGEVVAAETFEIQTAVDTSAPVLE